MDNILKQYYNDRFSMFGSKGWKDLTEDLLKMKEVTKDINNYQDEKAFWKAKGELSMINWLLNLEELSETAYKQLKED